MPPPNPLMSKASYAGLGAVRIFLLEGRNCMDSLSTACFYWGPKWVLEFFWAVNLGPKTITTNAAQTLICGRLGVIPSHACWLGAQSRAISHLVGCLAT